MAKQYQPCKLNLIYRMSICQKKGNVLKRNLVEAQEKSNEAIDKFQQFINSNPIETKDQPLASLFQNSLNKLSSISQLRLSVDALTVLPSDLNYYFESIGNELIDKIAHLAQQMTDKNIALTLFTQINLLREQIEAGKIKGIIFLALLNNEISLVDYNLFAVHLGRRDAFRDSYFDIATQDQDQLYKNIIKGPSMDEINQIEAQILKQGPEGKLSVDPSRWWGLKTERIGLLEQVQQAMLDDIIKESIKHRSELITNILTTLGVILLTLFVTLYLGYLNLKSLTTGLQNEINTLTASNQEILTAINQTSTGTSETATAVTETTTTVEELRQTAKAAAEKAKNVSDVSNQALNMLAGSEKSLEKMLHGMRHIEDRMKTISQSIVKLSENSQTIGNIINTVNELAGQSNLLAVNAAIEAAKAGEQGRGFAIVAQEVRSLAEQSKQATIQVRAVLQEIQDSTSAAVMATDQGLKAVTDGMDLSIQTGNSISSLSQEMDKVVQAASQISYASQQQLIGVDQVNIAMSNIKEASKQQVDNINHIEESMVELSSVGQSLKHIVEDYQI